MFFRSKKALVACNASSLNCSSLGYLSFKIQEFRSLDLDFTSLHLDDAGI